MKLVSLLIGLIILGLISSSVVLAKGSVHQDTLNYWTKERVDNAQPRDIILKGGPSANARPGKDTSSSGTTASWETPGLFKSATGKVIFHMSGGDWVCSGGVVEDTVVGRSLVVTAGHCVYDEVAGEFATYWMFIPDYDDGGSSSWYTGTCPEGRCWVADSLVTTAVWASNGSDKWDEDYAFAVIQDATHGGSSLEAATGSLPIAFPGNYSNVVHIGAFGYPAAKKYNGSDLVYCESDNNAVDDGREQTSGIECKMTGGSSGGPWIGGFDSTDQSVGAVQGVTSYSYSLTNGYLFGPTFDAYTEATYQAAQVASGNEVVTFSSTP